MASLQFLLLEDNPLDAEIVQVALSNGNIDYKLMRVETRTKFVTALEIHQFDLILADYALPDFDGISALEIARKLCPDVPFIFVSGSLGEELAIETLKNGATDYVLKQRLGRLVPSVQRALRETQERRERQRAEQELQQTHQTLKTLIESSPLAIALIEPDGTVRLWNPAAVRLFGWSEAEVLGQPIPIVPTDKLEECLRLREALAKGETFFGVETYRCKLDCSRIGVSISAAPVYDERGRVKEIILIFQDISERQRTDEALRIQARVLESMTESVVRMDATGIIQFTNAAFDTMFGYERGELLGQPAVVLNDLPPDENRQFVNEVITTLQQEQVWSGEVRNRKKDGTSFLTAAYVSTLNIEGNTYFVTVQQDITHRKQAELLMVEQKRVLELTASGQPLDECLSALCDSVSRLNPGTRACFLLTDAQRQRFKRSITPDFPPSFGQGLKDAPINDLCIGTCGEAVYRGQPMTCADIANDDRWSPEWRELCVAQGIRACYSAPVLGIDNLPLGSLMLCFNEARLPTDWEYQLAEFGTKVASIVFERDRSNFALSQNESRLRLIFESAKDYAIFTLDFNGIIASWNSGAERLLGYTEAEAIGCPGRMIFTPEDNEQGRPDWEMQTALTQGRAENERWHVRKDGSRFWASGLMMPLLDEADHPQGFVKILQDKTAQRQAGERLQLLYEATRDLLSTDQPLALMHNLFSKLSAQLELHCYYNFMVEEKDSQQMLHLVNHEGLSEEAAQAIKWINFGEYLCGLVAQSRQQIVLSQAQLSPHPNAQAVCAMGITAYAGQPLIAQGRLLGTLSFASRTRTDFTPAEIELLQSTCDQIAIALERANLTASLQQQAKQLRQANRIKDEFLAVLSHELRSPLNPILGWSKLLQNGKLDKTKTAQGLATIERNAKLQSELIEDLLNVSRILQGKLSLNVSPVNPAATIKAAIETVHLAAEAKSITVEATLDPEIGQVSGDATRLQQVFWNLLSNAVKFTAAGGRVAVRLEQVGNQAQITVSDTGKGIHPDFLPFVFDYFRQQDGTTTRKFGGLGLGLAIVRHLVELHGGTVQADSPGEGLGATFTVKLPLIPVPTAINLDHSASEPSLDLNEIQVLVIDDEMDSREFVAFVLEQAGARVITATTADEGFATLIQYQPDVLLSDIGMPNMDGYMLMQQIRALPPEQGGQIPAIALTAYAGDFNQQQALAAGFQQHVAKPIEPEALIKIIATLMGKSQNNS
ncbi:PAS domain S-box protein [Komarekiella sp. 'clone 1']|uniref:Circadian input-output histidine kinase CikA n=1 Tax=Komarekiella delphini-convector SJRDD-AB1 TaxID=2593771 RepID=A0AA40T0S3_9NOST|nr:PAS domain S-box protein [Komarekiella delphini-convector]MBD6618851.1 PAS domain S-box protein [Komarekiella delphini-convector SJRDD-AB1]